MTSKIFLVMPIRLQDFYMNPLTIHHSLWLSEWGLGLVGLTIYKLFRYGCLFVLLEHDYWLSRRDNEQLHIAQYMTKPLVSFECECCKCYECHATASAK